MPPERVTRGSSVSKSESNKLNILKLPACQRCRSRKTKCDNRLPQCTSCHKAKLECIGFDPTANRSVGRSYVLELEEKVAALESDLNARRSSVSSAVPCSPVFPSPDNHSPKTAPPGTYAATGHDPTPTWNPHRTSAYNVTLNPRHYGPPSLLQYLQRLPGVQADSFAAQAMAPFVSQNHEGMNSAPPIDQVEILSFLPDKESVNTMLDQFLDYTNAAFPIFHSGELQKQVDTIFATPCTATCEDLYTVFAVLGIASWTMSRNTLASDFRHMSQRFWNRAQLYAEDAFATEGLRRLQFIHLHLQYIMHHPESDSVWEVSGAAIRLAVDLGLHHEQDRSELQPKPNPLELDMRRRLFWTSYCVDRNLATALGRPPSIPDEWISAKYPATVDDELISRSGIQPGPSSPRKMGARHQCLLRHIQTDIQKNLYTVNSAQLQPPPPEWFDEMKTRLEEWKDTIPSPLRFLSYEWYNLNYHVSRCLLFRPCPRNPQPRVKELEEAIASAAGVFQVFKVMLRNSRINYVWLSIHHLFISGITYLNALNALWEKGGPGVVKCPQLITAILDIQTCSGLLEALTTIEPSLTGIRDAFEKISGAVIRRLSNEHSKGNANVQGSITPTTASVGQTKGCNKVSPMAERKDAGKFTPQINVQPSEPCLQAANTEGEGELEKQQNHFESSTTVASTSGSDAPFNADFSVQPSSFSPVSLDLDLMNDFLFHPMTGLSLQGVNSLSPIGLNMSDDDNSGIDYNASTSQL